MSESCGWRYGTMGMHPCQIGLCVAAADCPNPGAAAELATSSCTHPCHRRTGAYQKVVGWSYCPKCGEGL